MLLIELKKAGVGCFIGNWFATALGYADDVVLLAPPIVWTMRTMLMVCDKFADEFNVIFNTKKSNAEHFTHRKTLLHRHLYTRHSVSPLFSISGIVISRMYLHNYIFSWSFT